MHNESTEPSAGFLRLKDVLKLIPVSKSSWWEGVRTGQYPPALKIGPRTTAWRSEDIQQLIRELSKEVTTWKK